MGDYTNIKKRLVERREALAVLIERVEKSARRKLDKDFEEQAIQRENEEVLTSLDDSLNEELKQIGHALERMESGEYGKCESCGEEISVKRLEAVPHANYCIKCAV
jgi:RNA polymerase-binding protein DksA